MPRIEEIINATSDIKCTIITAQLEKKFQLDLKAAEIIRGRIEITCLKEVMKHLELVGPR